MKLTKEELAELINLIYNDITSKLDAFGELMERDIFIKKLGIKLANELHSKKVETMTSKQLIKEW